MMIKAMQGFRFKRIVKTPQSKIIVKGDEYKLVLDNVETQDGSFYITERADATALWTAGKYKYQILNEEGLEEEGDFEILRNYYLADDVESVKTENEKLLDAIEAQLAGKATAAQQSMSVGDKSISYCSIDELLKLKEYFKRKVDEEKGSIIVDGNEIKIKHKWSMR